MTTAALSQYRYLSGTREGRIALRAVWFGLLVMSGGVLKYLCYVPMLRDMHRRGLIRHLGLHYAFLGLIMVISLMQMVAMLRG